MGVMKAMKTVEKSPKAVVKAMKVMKETKDAKNKPKGSEEIKDLIKMIRVPRKIMSPLREAKKKQQAEEKKITKKSKAVVEKSESSGAAVKRAPKKTEVEKKPIQEVAAKAPKKDSLEAAVLEGARLRQKLSLRKSFTGRSPVKAVKAAKAVQQAAKADPVVANTEARPEGPKRPVGGAYGVFLAEQRSEIVKSLPAGHKMTDVAKKAGELYKALTEDELNRFKEQYKANTETYKEAVVDWEKACVAAGHPLETTPSKKRKMDNVTPTKYSKVKVSAEAAGPLDPDALREASGLGYKHEEAFRNLAACVRLIDNKVPHAKIVRALRASGGSEKKAFAALANC